MLRIMLRIMLQFSWMLTPPLTLWMDSRRRSFSSLWRIRIRALFH
jgi:hypothetical protein